MTKYRVTDITLRLTTNVDDTSHPNLWDWNSLLDLAYPEDVTVVTHYDVADFEVPDD